VELIWHCSSAPLAHAKERLMPDGSMSLIVNLREDAISIYDAGQGMRKERLRGTVLAGVRSEFCVIDTDCQIEIMGVVFKPGGAFPFLRLPAGELHGLDVNLETVWGARATELRDRLLDAPTLAEKFQVMEAALRAALVPARERHPVVAFALRAFRSPEPTSVAGVVERTGFSARRFIALFTREVGLTPKLFLRVQRFQHVVRRLHADHEPALADVALTCGYYDQSHFIHDFRAFSGVSPTDYLARRGRHANHVAVDG
jgi:AraC-like DNA-binding protein